MKRPGPNPRRTAPRFRLKHPVRMRVRTLPLVAGPTSGARGIVGHIQNISPTGLCLLAAQRLRVSELLVGEIGFPGTRASVPTLLQVRWCRKNSSGARYRAGLNFVFQGGMVAALRAPRTAAGRVASGNSL